MAVSTWPGRALPLAALSCVAALALTPGCNPRTGEEVDTITITPAEALVETGGDARTVQLQARARGGEDVTRSCAWSSENPSLGTISQGLFTTAAGLERGGVVKVRCDKDGATGAGLVRVKILAPDLVDGGAPDDVVDSFGGPTIGAAPQVIYPLSGALLARNIAQMRVAWRAEAEQRRFRVVLDGPLYRQSIYLGARACAGTQCSYRVPDSDWRRVADAAGAGDVQLVVSATSAPGEAVGRSPAVSLRFSPDEVRGGLYYFSTTRLGIMRLPFGGQKAVPFLPGVGGTSVNACIGCHAISRDGKKVAALWSGADGYAGIVDGADPMKYLLQPVVKEEARLWNFASFNPAGDRLVGNWKGELTLRSGTDGALIKRIEAALLGGRAAMPEWSPDGKWIVFVRLTDPDGKLGTELADDPQSLVAGDWILGNAGDIAMIPYNDGNFGQAVTVVPRLRDSEYHFYPSFSPDSRWIVFNSVRRDACFSPTARRNGVDAAAGVCISYDQRGARLRLVRAAEGATPVELTAATHEANRTTAWPKFAPFQQAGGKLVFFTFSAKFDYGWVVQQAQIKAMTGDERPQLWMSAIDLGKAESGAGDPSYAPFWLPFQDAATNNHEVIWTTDIACKTAADCGDEFDCIAGVCVRKIG